MIEDFGYWMLRQRGRFDPAAPRAPAAPPEATAEPMLPDGVWEGSNGAYEARCRRCERVYELYCDPEKFNDEYNLCGGSPECCP